MLHDAYTVLECFNVSMYKQGVLYEMNKPVMLLVYLILAIHDCESYKI